VTRVVEIEYEVSVLYTYIQLWRMNYATPNKNRKHGINVMYITTLRFCHRCVAALGVRSVTTTVTNDDNAFV